MPLRFCNSPVFYLVPIINRFKSASSRYFNFFAKDFIASQNFKNFSLNNGRRHIDKKSKSLFTGFSTFYYVIPE